MKNLAPQVGLEPTTLRLTAGCSAIELLRSVVSDWRHSLISFQSYHLSVRSKTPTNPIARLDIRVNLRTHQQGASSSKFRAHSEFALLSLSIELSCSVPDL